ncbi:hypothetical protein ACF3MZ_29200 [Paenibacillaceae bacterium WGS1546]|uniref:hypothetical protein n=1 Tax=Cohnella sp. WGS1546 TaxID=3366810 RepID=UPI00372D1946
MNYVSENGNVYYIDEVMTKHIGTETKTDTVRIDKQTVKNITYQFDFNVGEYVEQSSTMGVEPLTPDPDNRIAQLEAEMAKIVLELVDTQIRLANTERRLEQTEEERAGLLLEIIEKKEGAINGLVRNLKAALRRRSI